MDDKFRVLAYGCLYKRMYLDKCVHETLEINLDGNAGGEIHFLCNKSPGVAVPYILSVSL